MSTSEPNVTPSETRPERRRLSKKLAALAAGTLLLAVVHLLLDEPAARDVAEQVTALFAAYLLGQGVADHGKQTGWAAGARGRDR